MDFLRFEYVYSVFNVGTLVHLINGVSFTCSKRVILKSEDYSGVDEEAQKFTLFNENTDFDNYGKLDHLCLVDANNLTDKQIKQLRRLSTKGVHVTILSNKMDGTEETRTFKKLNRLKENEIIKKRVSYVCQCGTYDAEITKEENEKSKVHDINGIKWYSQCNINCFDNVRLTKEEENSKEYKNFNNFLYDKRKQFNSDLTRWGRS